LALIPIVDFILLRGWRLALVKRMATGEKEPLPNADVISFFKYGCVLWFMTILYLIIPTIIIFSVGAGELGNLFAALNCLRVSVFSSGEGAGLVSCLQAEANELIIRFFIEAIWLVISTPLYRVAMIRYAITGKKRVFFNLPLNALIALQHFKTLFMMWVFGFFMVAILTLITLVFTSTFILIPLIPIVVLVTYYYATGYEYGHLAHTIVERKQTRSKPIEVVELPST